MGGRVIVVGSVNVDLVASVERLPAPGETVVGATFARHPGGKGGNQAVAAARLGASVAFVGAVGDDPLAAEAREALADEGVDTTELATSPGPTGVALILVDAGGENLIAVASGANGALTPPGVETALRRLAVGPGDVVLVSNEIPADAVVEALRVARSAAATTVLNPAPATGLDLRALDWSDVVVPNEGELQQLVAALQLREEALASAGRPQAVARALQLLRGDRPDSPGAGSAVVTRGARGALIVRGPTDVVDLPAPAVTAIDTVGAGDTFVGALAAGLAEGRPLEDAARRSVVAASLSTTRPGARGGMPRAPDLEAAIADLA